METNLLLQKNAIIILRKMITIENGQFPSKKDFHLELSPIGNLKKFHVRAISGERNIGSHIDDTSSRGTTGAHYIDDTSSHGTTGAHYIDNTSSRGTQRVIDSIKDCIWFYLEVLFI